MGLIITILVIVAVIGLYIASTQRKFVHYDELAENALSQIGVQQQSRWEALTQLAKATKGYSEHEYKTLMDVIGQRTPASANPDADAVEKNESIYREAMSRFNLVVENYPQIKASDVYKKTMDSIDLYEDRVRKGRMVYNDTVTKWNRLRKQFPSNLVGSLLGYEARNYLQTDESVRSMPDLEF